MVKQPDRVFEDSPAVRTSVPLMVGLVGPSGGGKTYSALRLATGFQRVTGGEIYFIDTEARRALHYADRFKFRHLPFGAPFSPLDYLAAIEHCVSKGAKTVIVDSMSHEHEGPGGVLEMHDEELQRLGGSERNSFQAWGPPKAARRRMVNSILQQPCNFIFCFRAKDKIKPPPKGSGSRDMVELGYMPIAGEELVFEMTMNALLLPNAGGIPTWKSEFVGERSMLKLPEMFKKQMLGTDQPLSEETGEMLAKWAAGGSTSDQRSPSSPPPANTLLFNRTYADWGGKPIGEAPSAVVANYILALQSVLNDASKAKAHPGTRKHLDAVQDEYERTLAEEALGA